MAGAEPGAPAPLVAVTGGIASGKSTVAAMLARLGAAVVDADQLARRALAPATEGLARVRAIFGEGILDGSGNLDRARLGEVVFSDPEARLRLEGIVHPLVGEMGDEEIRLARASGAPLIAYDTPLLFETGGEGRFDGILVVHLGQGAQLQRLMARSGLNRSRAEQRIRSQMALDRKAKLATWVVENDGSLEQTRARVEALWPLLLETGPRA